MEKLTGIFDVFIQWKLLSVTRLIIVAIMILNAVQFLCLSHLYESGRRSFPFTLSPPTNSKNNSVLRSSSTLGGERWHSSTFSPWPKDRPFPCYSFREDSLLHHNATTRVEEDNYHDDSHDDPFRFHLGLQFVKIPKAASSTSAGVALRIAHHRGGGPHGHGHGHCRIQHTHGYAHERNYTGRDRARSFLWTTLRDPVDRILSAYNHFRVARRGFRADDEDAIRAFARQYRDNDQLAILYTRGPKTQWLARVEATLRPTTFFWPGTRRRWHRRVEEERRHVTQRMVGETLEDYDFLGLAERMDESLVVLRLLLRLDVSDVAYLSSKEGGTYDDHCYFVPKRIVTGATLSKSLRQFFRTDPRWLDVSRGDYWLYDAVNRRLDATIEDVIGRERFERALEEHYRFLRVVRETCTVRTVWPCSRTTGENRSIEARQHCYWNDNGCGYPSRCFDHRHFS